jgi:DNA repair exonuclease SbcCD ATPase subunit
VHSQAEIRAARKTISRIERRLGRIAEEETTLHEEMATRATDFEAVGRLDARLKELATEKDELEMAWLEAAEVAG